MKVISFFVLAFLCSSILLSQVNVYNNVEHNTLKYDVIIIDIDYMTIQNFSIRKNDSLYAHNLYLSKNWQDSAVFIINASISDTLCNPIGWFVSDGLEIQPVNESDGYGNFYLKPNGAVILTQDEGYIIETDSIPYINNVQFGIQSGPMLLNDGKINSNFNSSSTNKHIRSGVGIINDYGKSKLIFAISLQPVSFYQFTKFFKEVYNCRNALCLESAGAIFKYPFMSNFSDKRDIVICNYIIYNLN
jgi:uncharacterized protein YigE (DUF2233 family)